MNDIYKYKEGDILICKKDYFYEFLNQTGTKYIEGKTYIITHADYSDYKYTYYLSSDGHVSDSFDANTIFSWRSFDFLVDHFYTLQELRKLKIERLKDV